METLRRGRRQDAAHGWVASFRATDAWVVAAWEAAGSMPPGRREIARILRDGAIECGACLVAAAEGESREAHLTRARRRLHEARYALYLARRLSALDGRRYRTLSGYLERALRETASLRPPPPPG